jgi:hypothetical protein
MVTILPNGMYGQLCKHCPPGDKTKQRVDNNTSPVPKRVGRSSKGLSAVSDEDAGRYVVVVSPDAGVFDSMHEQLRAAGPATSKSSTRPSINATGWRFLHNWRNLCWEPQFSMCW